MSREQYIKELIAKNGYNIKSFANYIDMPYSTLLSMLNGSIGGAAIDNVIKICKGLNITINDLQEHDNASGELENQNFVLTEHEKRVISAYRNNPSMQGAVDKLLNVGNDCNCEIASDMCEVLKQADNIRSPIKQK